MDATEHEPLRLFADKIMPAINPSTEKRISTFERFEEIIKQRRYSLEMNAAS